MASVSSATDIVWSAPPDDLALEERTVHVWRAELNADEETTRRCRALLSEDERERADRFLRDVHRERFTLCRAALRCMLGRYIGCRPELVAFDYDASKKPRLRAGRYDADVRFNLAHSRDRALFAFTLDREIGVDLEFLDPATECEKLAKRFFSPAESEALMALPQTQRLEGFFNCWTRKEAYVKARGEGIAFGLDRFRVSLQPGDKAALLAIDDASDTPSNWLMQSLWPFPEYVGAILAHRETKAWEYFEVPPPDM